MRLIDVDALPDDAGWCGDALIEAINNAPTISAERTGTCKTCKRRHIGSGFCPMVHMSMDGELYELNEDNDFCSRFEGEKYVGKWIYEDGSYFCSECREFCIDNEEHEPVRSNFCPNCGARMVKE